MLWWNGGVAAFPRILGTRGGPHLRGEYRKNTVFLRFLALLNR